MIKMNLLQNRFIDIESKTYSYQRGKGERKAKHGVWD